MNITYVILTCILYVIHKMYIFIRYINIIFTILQSLTQTE